MHTTIATGFQAASGNGDLDHVFATCSCGYRVATSLGAGTFNRTTLFARQDLAQHIQWANAQGAK